MLESARAHAERIRRESERELAAAMARRDSITSQLSNVRTMLATFGVGVGVGDDLLTGGDLPDELLDEVVEVAEVVEVPGGRGLGEIGQEGEELSHNEPAHNEPAHDEPAHNEPAQDDVTQAVTEQGESAESMAEAAVEAADQEVQGEDAEPEPVGRP